MVYEQIVSTPTTQNPSLNVARCATLNSIMVVVTQQIDTRLSALAALGTPTAREPSALYHA